MRVRGISPWPVVAFVEGSCRWADCVRGCALVCLGLRLLLPEVSRLKGIGAEGVLCCSLGGGCLCLRVLLAG